MLTPRRALLVASAAAWLARLVGAFTLGFGDAEALYASYALHPSVVYVDHPGLVGWVAWLVGGGGAPSPLAAHLVTGVLATLVPWVAAWAAERLGAEPERAPLAGLALFLAPEITIGLFGLNPDLFLCLAWLGALGALGAPDRERPWLVASALVVGVCAKVSMACLVPVVAVLAWRRRSRGLGAAAVVGAMAVGALVAADARLGFPMLRHRFVETQDGSGFSLANVARTVGGQLVYLSPVLAVAAALGVARLARRRDEASFPLVLASLVAAVVLVPLSSWSRVSEPHWIAPVFLPVALAHARTPIVGPRFATACVATAGVVLVAAHAWILTDLAPRWLGGLYEPRYDIANDLRTWRTVTDAVRRAPPADVVVTPHWTVAAQLHAAIPSLPVVTVAGRDDFARWSGNAKSAVERARTVMWVTDDRFFDLDRRPDARGTVVANQVVEVHRGGRVVRRVRILVSTME